MIKQQPLISVTGPSAATPSLLSFPCKRVIFTVHVLNDKDFSIWHIVFSFVFSLNYISLFSYQVFSIFDYLENTKKKFVWFYFCQNWKSLNFKHVFCIKFYCRILFVCNRTKLDWFFLSGEPLIIVDC